MNHEVLRILIPAAFVLLVWALVRFARRVQAEDRRNRNEWTRKLRIIDAAKLGISPNEVAPTRSRPFRQEPSGKDPRQRRGYPGRLASND